MSFEILGIRWDKSRITYPPPKGSPFPRLALLGLDDNLNIVDPKRWARVAEMLETTGRINFFELEKE